MMKNIMRKNISICALIFSILMVVACAKKDDKPFEPYGAEKINYDDIKNISKDGPTIEVVHEENVPPFGEMQATKELGPSRNNNEEAIEPTADLDEFPDYGGIPIVTKEPRKDRESESETNESEQSK